MEKKEFFVKMNLIDDKYKLEAEIPEQKVNIQNKKNTRLGYRKILYVAAAVAIFVLVGKVGLEHCKGEHIASNGSQTDKTVKIGEDSEINKIDATVNSCEEYFAYFGVNGINDIKNIAIDSLTFDSNGELDLEHSRQITDKQRIKQVYDVFLNGTWDDAEMMADDEVLQEEESRKYMLVFETNENENITAIYYADQGYLSPYDSDYMIALSTDQNQSLLHIIED